MPYPNLNIANSPYQISADFLGVCGMNFAHRHSSAGRIQMLSNHLGQRLVIEGATERGIQTGMERKFGQKTFNVQMPADGVILEIIPRQMPNRLGGSMDNEIPEYLVIYQSEKVVYDERGRPQLKREVGCFTIPQFMSYHQYFGYPLVKGKDHAKLYRRSHCKAGDVFFESPAVTPEGGYMYGVDANVAYMTHPATSEDGILVNRSFLEKLRFKTYHTRVIEYGSSKVLLNLYGDDKHYKPLPDIGEVIGPNNLLAAARQLDTPELAGVEMTNTALREVDYFFDDLTYAEGAGGIVRDIRVSHNIALSGATDPYMDAQVLGYDQSRRQFYEKLLAFHNSNVVNPKDKSELYTSPEYSSKVYEAFQWLQQSKGNRVILQHRKQPQDLFRIEVVIEYTTTPNVGFKLTDCHGGKGVIVQLANHEDMPRDADGNVADIVMDPMSTLGRMNMGRKYEQYYNGARRDMHKKLCHDLLGIQPFTRAVPAENHIRSLPQAQVQQAWDYLMRFDEIISPLKRQIFAPTGQPMAMKAFQKHVLPPEHRPPRRRGENPEYDENPEPEAPGDAVSYLAEIVARGNTILYPPDNPVDAKQTIRELQAEYPSTYGPITYVGNSGKRVTTLEPVRIAPVYIMLLEKTGDDWSASSSPKLTHHGIPAQITKLDRDSKPARNQAVRHDGESEVRIKLSYIGPRFVAEQMDRNNNPTAHRMLMDSLMRSAFPTNMAVSVDRTVIGYGGSKPLQLAKHMAYCGGWKFEYAPYNPTMGQAHEDLEQSDVDDGEGDN